MSETYKLTNDLRAAKIEEFLLAEATKVGVVEEKSNRKTSANPNKWDKHLAPWYNMQCRSAKRAFHRARLAQGKNHESTIQALKQFVQ